MIPIPVLDAPQAAAWDDAARNRHGIPGRALMEAAGRAVAQVVTRNCRNVLRQGVLLAAGPGNNGGDGWVAARALAAVGIPVRAVEAAAERRSPDCEATRAMALSGGVELLAPGSTWPVSGLVLDALLGTGASGALRGEVEDLARRVAAFGAPVVAVDGPTGLDLSTGEARGPIRAALTVSFGGVRRGHLLARDWCGKIVIVDIGFPPADRGLPLLMDDSAAREILPPFESNMHKGDRGRVLVIGGDEGMVGAAIHASRAALSAGAGLVKLAGSAAAVRAANETLPDALSITIRLTGELEPELRDAVEWADAVVMGPGLGRGPERAALVCALLDAARASVIDADALHAGAQNFTAGRGTRVLTPHPGEFAAAFPAWAKMALTDRFDAAARAAESARCTVLLKGVPTVVASPGMPSRVVAAGTPALATGGSGDVLAGFIGAFLARGVAPHLAASLGAHALGRAAEIAAEQQSARAARPADVLAAVPTLWIRWTDPPVPDPPVLAELPQPLLV